jgi:hypothetical protein
MPTIQDVANQINAKLDQISVHTADTVAVGNAIRGDLTQVNTKLDNIDGDLQAGVAELAAGVFAVWEQQKLTNSILEHHSRQNDTIICLLENTTELLCGMTRKMTKQIEISESELTSVKRLEGIAERVHADAAADYDRNAALKAQLLECCPPSPREPEPCPEACPVPKERPYRPKGQDWKPSPRPDHVG